MDCGRDATFAKAVLAELLEQDIFVRMPGVAPLDRCIRVSAGTDGELDGGEKSPSPSRLRRPDAGPRSSFDKSLDDHVRSSRRAAIRTCE